MERKICISMSNKKLGNGAIPSISLPQYITCNPEARKHCGGACYARFLNGYRKTVRDAYLQNYNIYREDPNGYFESLYLWVSAKKPEYFRYHSSGDIPDSRYFAGMVDLANRIPEAVFMAYTKQYDIVNGWMAEHGGEIPENLHIWFSGWGTAISFENPYHFNRTDLIFGDKLKALQVEHTGETFLCPGACVNCKMCYTRNRDGLTVLFHQHGGGINAVKKSVK